MPIYEYVCEKCGQTFEVWQKISESPVEEHDGCGGHPRRVISATTFSLKGNGWYKDGYGLKSSKSESTSTPPASSGDSKKSAA